MECIARKTHPKLANHPLGLVLEDPQIPIFLIGHEGVVVKRRCQPLCTGNLHEPGPVKLAQEAEDAIGKTSVSTWGDDVPVPAKLIHTNY
jgi:hypothetical protein